MAWVPVMIIFIAPSLFSDLSAEEGQVQENSGKNGSALSLSFFVSLPTHNSLVALYIIVYKNPTSLTLVRNTVAQSAKRTTPRKKFVGSTSAPDPHSLLRSMSTRLRQKSWSPPSVSLWQASV